MPRIPNNYENTNSDDNGSSIYQTVEKIVVVSADEIKQRLRFAFKETPAKEITNVDNKSIGNSHTLPVNTKNAAILPFATMGSAYPR